VNQVMNTPLSTSSVTKKASTVGECSYRAVRLAGTPRVNKSSSGTTFFAPQAAVISTDSG